MPKRLALCIKAVALYWPSDMRAHGKESSPIKVNLWAVIIPIIATALNKVFDFEILAVKPHKKVGIHQSTPCTALIPNQASSTTATDEPLVR